MHPARSICCALSLFLLFSIPAEGKARRNRRPAQAAVAQVKPAPPPSGEATAGGPRGPARIDFDDQLIKGQRNRSGTVYLYERKPFVARTLAGPRAQFRDEIAAAAEAL